MRKYAIGLAFILAIALGCSSAVAQTKQPSAAATATDSFDPHDLSGVWMQDRPRLSRVVERS